MDRTDWMMFTIVMTLIVLMALSASQITGACQ